MSSKKGRRTTVTLAPDVVELIDNMVMNVRNQFPDAHVSMSNIINNNLRKSLAESPVLP